MKSGRSKRDPKMKSQRNKKDTRETHKRKNNP